MSSKTLFISLGIILAASLVVLSSIARQLFLLQALWVVLGIGLILLGRRVDFRAALNHRWFIWGIYAFAIILLILVLVQGNIVRNTRSWLIVGPLTFQPVELAKLALILVYARYFSRRHIAIARPGSIAISFLLFAIPAGLTAIQPDLGSTTILFGIWVGFLLVSGLPRRWIVAVFAIIFMAAFAGWHVFLKDYQRARIVGVFYPEQHALGINYSAIQSKIAIGHAGFWGQGYAQGTQTQLGFLTEPASDFILSALIEEWGVATGLLVMAAFLTMIFHILKLGTIAHHNFEKFVCLGTAVVFGTQFLLNAGSAVGLMPVVGVTFPFLSYGGSSIIINFALLSVVSAIAAE